MLIIFCGALGELFDWVIFAPSVQKASRLRINQSIDWGRLWGMIDGWGLAEWRIPFHLTRIILFPELQHLVTLTSKQASVDRQVSTQELIATTTLTQ